MGCVGPMICVDYGAPNTRFVFTVTDADGSPIANAVLRASLSFGGKHAPSLRGLEADDNGQICFTNRRGASPPAPYPSPAFPASLGGGRHCTACPA